MEQFAEETKVANLKIKLFEEAVLSNITGSSQFMAEPCERDVLYSCGSCGYPLNLSSSQRVVSSLDSKALRKGTISFLCIDESRFQQLDELKCAPHLHANGSLRLHQLRTKLLCGKCGNVIGHGHADDRPACLQIEGSDSSSGSATPEHKRYCVKIKALQPSLNAEPIAPAAG
ncbi:hypothetical protein L7F22_029014 [Adiantum nelumboides]|nr:hypothetical protein [Adiantum nelumboides]